MHILNLTQHTATAEQIATGVVEPSSENKGEIQGLLTFTSLPSRGEIRARANALAGIAVQEGLHVAMVGGAPYLMSALEKALEEVGVRATYAFSERVSEEVAQPDGTVRKTNVFRHLGFVSPLVD